MKLGFCNLAPRYLYIGKGGWYHWDHDLQQPILIKQKGLRGYLKAIDLKEQTFKGKTSLKLLIYLSTDDEDFVIKSGLNSWFSKTILLRLRSLEINQLSQPITIGVQSGQDENVLFGVIRPSVKLPEGFDYSRLDESQLIDLATLVNNRIKQSTNN